MTEKDKADLAFFTVDGFIRGTAVLLGGLLLKLHSQALFNIMLAVSIGSGLAVGWSEYLCEKYNVKRPNYGLAMVSFIGSFIPSLPFFFWKGFSSYSGSIILIYFIMLLIRHLRGSDPIKGTDFLGGILILSLTVLFLEFLTGGIN